MARYRKVDVRIWGDEDFRSFSDKGKVLFLYFITPPESTSVPGLFAASRAGIADLLGWTLEAFGEAFAEVSAKGKVKADWKARVVWVPNARKYNTPESPNVVRSWSKHLDEVPECELKNEAIRELEAFAKALGKGFSKAFTYALPKGFEKPSGKASPNQEQDQEQDQDLRTTQSAGARPEPAAPEPDHRGQTAPPATLQPDTSDYGVGQELNLTSAQVDELCKQYLDSRKSLGWKSADWHADFRTWLRKGGVRSKGAAATKPNGSVPVSEAMRVWSAAYAKKYGTAYAGGSEGMAELVVQATEAATVALESGTASDPLGKLVAACLVHWFREYLRDDGGEKAFLVQAGHALKFLRPAAYGTPWKVDPEKAQEQFKAARAALVASVGGGGR